MSESTVTLLNNPYGQFTFDLFRKEELAFVDKSLSIKYLDDNGTSWYPVLLRPCRFGKSTFVRMLKCYYDISYQDRYDELFSGTKIYDLNLPTHNSYHVINFDFSAVSTGNLNKLLTSFFVAVADGIRDFKRRYKDFVFDYSDIDKTDVATVMSDCKIMFSSKGTAWNSRRKLSMKYRTGQRYNNFSFKQFYRENQVYPQRTVHKDLSFFVIQSFKFQVRLCFWVFP